MEQEKKPSSMDSIRSLFAGAAIVVIIIIAWILYLYVLGNPNNFKNEKPVNVLGIVYEGGVIVPFLMAFFMIVLTFSIERLITISLASGKGSVSGFVRRIKNLLMSNNVNEAIDECDKQKGSVGNVMRSVLGKYQEMSSDTILTKEQKVLSIQKELEESTSLELPMLEKNLVIIATLASVSTLVGLLGTVIGMIRAFSALAATGAPDSSALATGISEALINTALGIATSALAIIMYNYFTSKIDSLSYSIDEAGFSVVQSFNANHK